MQIIKRMDKDNSNDQIKQIIKNNTILNRKEPTSLDVGFNFAHA